jgi:hypothetical protein
LRPSIKAKSAVSGHLISILLCRYYVTGFEHFLDVHDASLEKAMANETIHAGTSIDACHFESVIEKFPALQSPQSAPDRAAWPQCRLDSSRRSCVMAQTLIMMHWSRNNLWLSPIHRESIRPSVVQPRDRTKNARDSTHGDECHASHTWQF